MKWSISLFLCVMAGLACPVHGQGEAPAPDIFCAEPVFDFGSQDNSGSVTHGFVIENRGQAVLAIEGVRTSCGCTVAEVADKNLEPGEQTEIKAVFNLKNRTGAQHKTIRVSSNDPDTPTYTLELKGEATTEMTISPRHVFLGRIEAQTVATGVVEIVRSNDQPFAIESMNLTGASFQAEIEPLADGRNGYRVTVTSVPPLTGGHLRDSLTLETDYPASSRLSIPISAFVPSAQTEAP